MALPPGPPCADRPILTVTRVLKTDLVRRTSSVRRPSVHRPIGNGCLSLDPRCGSRPRSGKRSEMHGNAGHGQAAIDATRQKRPRRRARPTCQPTPRPGLREVCITTRRTESGQTDSVFPPHCFRPNSSGTPRRNRSVTLSGSNTTCPGCRTACNQARWLNATQT